MKELLSALATNLHIVVISMLIIALDLGVVRVGSNQSSHQKTPVITLSTTGSNPSTIPAQTGTSAPYGGGLSSSSAQALGARPPAATDRVL